MKLTFLGAAGEVTGSSTLIETDRARVLIDCGMFQGSVTADVKNRRPLAFDARTLDAVVLSHAHIDHSGRLPVLMRDDLRAAIWCTPATMALTGLLLKDSAHLQEEEAQRITRRRHRRGGRDVRSAVPLYTDEDVARVQGKLRTLPYAREQEIAPGVRLTFNDAGHILGSASMTLTISEFGKSRTIVFSGDIGERGAPILRDPVKSGGVVSADAVILESTYGDRDHRPLSETIKQFREIITGCHSCRGKMLLPAFAVGRTQTLIYELAEMHREGLLPPIPIYLDSPMGSAATKLYQQHKELFDEDAKRILNDGHNPLSIPTLKLSVSNEESRAINESKGAAIIIAGSGMCTGGRILHHLRHNLWKPETNVVIAGFQAEGTLGRRLVNREPIVKIFGEPIAVKATIHTLGGFSAHAGQTTLLDWISPLAPAKPRLFLNHGEDKPRTALAQLLQSKHNLKAELPTLNQSFEL
ncbi:MAG: MBL fold metallo-hydrolase [Phycisphaerales bacterium]|nr:MBL fold metallo-hydrolase [Phycisphaerales bacterium]